MSEVFTLQDYMDVVAKMERERDAATTLLPSPEQTINHLRAQIDAAAVREARATERIAELERERDAGSLTFTRFREANVARAVKWHPNGISSWSESDWLTAITGELGELASLIKMRNRERDGLPGNKFSPTHKQLADEIADVLTYLDLLAAVLNIDLGIAVVEKFNAVSTRVGFPDRIEVCND